MSTRTLPTLLALALGAGLAAPVQAQRSDFSLDRFDLGARQDRIMGKAPAFLEGYVRPPAADPPARDSEPEVELDELGELPGTEGLPPAVGPATVAEPVTDLTALLDDGAGEGSATPELPSLSDLDPSGSYTVAAGQGLGHVAQALLALIEADRTMGRIPELWVPLSGGRVGLPHVVACYNRGEPDDWSVDVGEVLALPPLQQVWTIIEHVKSEGSCPADIQVPRKQVAFAEPALGLEDFEFGGGFRVELGRTYSHYGAAARHYLARFMPEADIPPLYPAKGGYGMLHLMACFNSGDSQALDIRAGQLLRVPPPVAIADAARFLEEQGGACPPDFRPPGSSPRGAVAAAGGPVSRGL